MAYMVCSTITLSSNTDSLVTSSKSLSIALLFSSSSVYASALRIVPSRWGRLFSSSTTSARTILSTIDFGPLIVTVGGSSVAAPA